MPGWPYNTARWSRLRRQKLAQTPICEYCQQAIANSVDHVEPISSGGDPWAYDNLRSACQSCHSKKTARGPEAGAAKTDKPISGARVDGTPTDPLHHWNR